jgi:transposase
MNKQITKIEEAIDDIIDKDDDLNKKIEIIESVPGIGRTTAAMLVAEMPELGKIESKKIAALVGVAPYTQQSGQYKGKSFISGGRIVVRSAGP